MPRQRPRGGHIGSNNDRPIGGANLGGPVLSSGVRTGPVPDDEDHHGTRRAPKRSKLNASTKGGEIVDLTSENEDEKSPVKDAPKKTQETPRDWIDRWDKVAEEAQQERTKTLVEEQHQAFIDARHLPNPMKDTKALPTFDDSEPATKDNAWQRSMLLAEYRSECLEINRQNDAIREAYKKKHVDAKLKEIFRSYEGRIAAKDVEIAAKDDKIAAKDVEIAAKDDKIAAQDGKIAQLEKRLAEMDVDGEAEKDGEAKKDG